MKLRVAMIGCGYFGQFHLNAWHRLNDVDLIGIVERSNKRRDALAKHNPELAIYDSLDALQALGPIDILDVATPPQTHHEIIEPLLGAVNVIICQKPFCRSLEEAEALARLAEARGSKLIIHENFRFMPWYRKIKDILASERLGILRQAHFRFRPGDGDGPQAYLERQPYFRDMERFLIHETGIHWIDTFRYLFGEPKSVYADIWRTNPEIKGEDAGLLLFTFDQGLRVLFDGNRTLDHAAENHRLTMGEFIIEGSCATLNLNGLGEISIRHKGEIKAQNVPYLFNDTDFGGDCVFEFQSHIVQHLIADAALETEASQYLKNIRIEKVIYDATECEAKQKFLK